MMNKYAGIIAAAGAYTLWGVLPAYWKLLHDVPAYEILGHRMAWSLLLTFGMIMLFGRRDIFLRAARERSNLITFSTTAFLLAINWLLYIWAVNAGFIIEASLGYFINPLINVLFGMIFFREKLRVLQWTSIGFAVLGVLYLTFYYGQFPWIALVLAVTFAVYGLLHKKTLSVHLMACVWKQLSFLFLPCFCWPVSNGRGRAPSVTSA